MSAGPLRHRPPLSEFESGTPARLPFRPGELSQGQSDMSGTPLRRRVTITNPQGFHLRPVSAFAQRAALFEATVTVIKGDQRVNGKSPWELMFLAAEQGTELILEVAGPDAAAALELLAELLAAPAMDDTPQPPLPPKG